MESPELVVDADALTKNYGAVVAVNQVNLKIRKGELFGLIGPDGAGKTTIFHMLGGILDPTAGQLSVLGLPAREARLQIGYLTQTFSLYQDLTVEQNLEYAGGLRSVPRKDFLERSEHYLRLMDLKRFSDRLAGNLSGGMKQKLALCTALISRPRLLLLDEPTTGVDPVSRRDFWDVLATIAHEGVTIAVATPYLDEAERCSRIALIHKGVIQQEGTPQELKKNLGLHRLELRGAPLPDIDKLISTDPGVRSACVDTQEFGDRLDALVSDPESTRKLLDQDAKKAQIPIVISVQEPTLENVFALTIKRSAPPEAHPDFPFVGEHPQGDHAIEAKDLSKVFGHFQAVRDVNLSVAYGEIYGLLGANGAGKTTTIKMLCGLLEATSGSMLLAGASENLRDPALRKGIGYMSQKFTLYEDLTVLENLRFYGGVYQVPHDLMNTRIKWVLETCNLSGSENMLAGRLPGGFRQRLAFGATVLHQPRILFLDEPTSGVDPLARRQLWSLISAFANQGTAVLVTTHFLEEAEHCHRMGFMVAGQLVAAGTPEEIKKSQPGRLLEVRTDNNQEALAALRKMMARWQASIFGDALHLVAEDDAMEQRLIKTLKDSGLTVRSVRTIPFSLEDAFIGIVERTQGDAAA
jgi:ABC-2 type transport system ATP-binding protein